MAQFKLAYLLDDDAPIPTPPLREVALEQAIIATLDAVIAGPAAAAFARKEHEVGALFAALSITDAFHLHRRLSIPRTDDPIGKRLARMASERRARLVRFLGDARRRAARARCY